MVVVLAAAAAVVVVLQVLSDPWLFNWIFLARSTASCYPLFILTSDISHYPSLVNLGPKHTIYF